MKEILFAISIFINITLFSYVVHVKSNVKGLIDGILICSEDLDDERFIKIDVECMRKVMKIETNKPIQQTIKVEPIKPKQTLPDHSERFISERVKIDKNGKISIRV